MLLAVDLEDPRRVRCELHARDLAPLHLEMIRMVLVDMAGVLGSVDSYDLQGHALSLPDDNGRWGPLIDGDLPAPLRVRGVQDVAAALGERSGWELLLVHGHAALRLDRRHVDHPLPRRLAHSDLGRGQDQGRPGHNREGSNDHLHVSSDYNSSDVFHGFPSRSALCGQLNCDPRPSRLFGTLIPPTP